MMTRSRKADAIISIVGFVIGLTIIILYEYHLPMSVGAMILSVFIVGFLLITGINALFFGYDYPEEEERKIFKVGLDIHGLVDKDPEFFAELSRTLMEAGFEVHVLTGSHSKDGIHDELLKQGIFFTHLFSIADYHKELGTPMRYDEKGTPWIDEELWNKTKAEYCERNQIDLHLDDSKEYGKHFTTSYALASIKERK